MQDHIERFMNTVHAIWRYKWYIHLVAWPLFLLGILVVHYIPDQYEGTTQVYVDTESMLQPLLKGLAVKPNIDRQIRMMTRTLVTRPNLEKLMRMTDMDVQAVTPEKKEEMLVELMKKIKITGREKENLYTISYVNEDRELAQNIVSSLLNIFVESSLGGSRKDTDVAQKFLDKQIAEYEAKLLEAEERLKDFKQKNITVMPSEGKGYYETLQNTMESLAKNEQTLREAVRRRDEIRRQMRGESPAFDLTAQVLQADPVLEQRIAGHTARLDELLLKYTPEHPDVVVLKEKLEILHRQRDRDLEKKQQMAMNSPTLLEANPVYQELKIQLSTTEADIAVLTERVASYEARIEYLRKMVDAIPKVEAELARLNRDYDINKKNYEILVGRRESAMISEKAEASADQVNFKVVEPPRVSMDPIAPNRVMLASIVLVFCLLLGVAYAFLQAQLHPTFRDPRSVMDDLKLPVVGSVGVVWTRKQLSRRKMETRAFLLAGIGLASVYSMFIVIQVLS